MLMELVQSMRDAGIPLPQNIEDALDGKGIAEEVKHDVYFVVLTSENLPEYVGKEPEEEVLLSTFSEASANRFVEIAKHVVKEQCIKIVKESVGDSVSDTGEELLTIVESMLMNKVFSRMKELSYGHIPTDEGCNTGCSAEPSTDPTEVDF